MADTPENYVFVLNREDADAFHDFIYEWAAGWAGGTGLYEILEVDGTVLVLPTTGLDEKPHTIQLKRPVR